MIETDFGEKENCFHTLDLYTGRFWSTRQPPPPAGRVFLSDEQMSEYSCAHYRKTVFQTPESSVTLRKPLQEPSSALNIVRGPQAETQRRRDGASSHSLDLRVDAVAIPPSRLPRISASFKRLIEEGHLETLRDMYKNWLFFEVD